VVSSSAGGRRGVASSAAAAAAPATGANVVDIDDLVSEEGTKKTEFLKVELLTDRIEFQKNRISTSVDVGFLDFALNCSVRILALHIK
jgi:hypothetical protein